MTSCLARARNSCTRSFGFGSGLSVSRAHIVDSLPSIDEGIDTAGTFQFLFFFAEARFKILLRVTPGGGVAAASVLAALASAAVISDSR